MIVILDNLRSAHNVGSILRTCDALGVEDVYLCGITPTPSLNSKVKKTSLGAEDNLNIIYQENVESIITEIKNRGFQIIGLELSPNSVNIADLKTQEKFALVVGNEVSGVSEEAQRLCDALVAIPMKGIKESLNVSVAFGIAGYTLMNS